MKKKTVILGNGIAGYSAAREIRGYEKDTEIIMISEEEGLPYIRPLLSKTDFRLFQKGGMNLEEKGWYEEQRINHIKGKRIKRIRPEEKQVLLEDNHIQDYDTCIYALGAHSFIPAFAGSEQAGVLTLRTTADFSRIRRKVMTAESVVIIGGGAIGLELASKILQMDCHVTIIEAENRLLGRFLDEQSAAVLAEQSRKKGLNIYTGVQVKKITGRGKADGVMLSDGTYILADFVILSCGSKANIEVARASGLLCEQGVLVNRRLETSAPDIYAAGDCMQGENRNPRRWNYARSSGEIAGYNTVFPSDGKIMQAFSEPFLLHSMGISLFSIGNVEEREQVVTIVDETKNKASRPFQVNRHEGEEISYSKRFYLDGKLCGAILIGDLSKMEHVKRELYREEGK